MGMMMAGIEDKAKYTNALEILLEMGEFFQIQDDYLDCYGDPEVIGKIGTDIQDNKCGWLVVQALDRATAEQRKVLEENYARKDEACVQRVKPLYADMGLKKVFHDYEDESYARYAQMYTGRIALRSGVGEKSRGGFMLFACLSAHTWCGREVVRWIVEGCP